MGLSKTWYSCGNRALDDVSTALRSAASALFAMQGIMRGALSGFTNGATGAPPSSSYWTMEMSSNGTTAGAGNNFSATFVAAEWVRAAAGVAHTWFVLKSPSTPGILDGPYWILVSMAGASDQNITVTVSRVAFTGGSITADPTTTNGSLYASTQFHPNTTTAGKAHFCVDAKGNFYFLTSKNSTGYAHFVFGAQELVDTRSSGDASRFVTLLQYNDAGRGVPQFFSAATGVRGHSANGTTALTSTTGNMLNARTSSSALQSILTSLNGIDSKVDGLPIAYIIDTTAGLTGLKGRIPDLWCGSAQASVGAGDPTGAAPTRILMGDSVIPLAVTPGL